MAVNRLVRMGLAAGCATLWITVLGCGGGSEEPTGGETAETQAPVEKASEQAPVEKAS